MATSSVLEGYPKKEEEEEIMVLKKPLMEDHEILCKRRKHSAIREYPSGYGRFTAKLQQGTEIDICDDRKLSVLDSCTEEEEEEEEEEAILRDRKPLMGTKIPRKRQKLYSAIRDYPPGCGRFAAIKQDITVLDGCCSDEEEEEEEEEETMDRDQRKPLMKSEILHRRSKYSAIRDYPPGCGRFAVSSSNNLF